MIALCLVSISASHCRAAESDFELPPSVDDAEDMAADSSLPSGEDRPSFAETLDGDSSSAEEESAVLNPESADFDGWEPLTEGGLWGKDSPELRPFDWFRKWGFHHSSTEGRYVDKSVPMQYTSWLNRPYHIGFFSGPLLGSELNGNVVEQQSAYFGGLRLGWDFDYFWGVETRWGWSNPDINSTLFTNVQRGGYFAGDVNLVYYPWGDTKVRPFLLMGLGMVQLDTFEADGSPAVLDGAGNPITPTPSPLQVTMLSMPLGGGVQFPITHWAAMRLDIVDNLAFGGDGVDTLNNFSFTAGLEMRLGARPNSYWPWRTARRIW